VTSAQVADGRCLVIKRLTASALLILFVFRLLDREELSATCRIEPLPVPKADLQ
jgi:hypothetical protein